MANDSELMVAVLVWFWWNVVVAIAIAVWYAGKMPGEGKKLLKYENAWRGLKRYCYTAMNDMISQD